MAHKGRSSHRNPTGDAARAGNRGKLGDCDLELRVRRLELMRDMEKRLHAYGAECDEGPYDADRLLSSWALHGRFENGDERYSGHEELGRFFNGLVASSTLHYFSNVTISAAVGQESMEAHCYGFELPVIRGDAFVAAFEHTLEADLKNAQGQWVNWRQEVRLFCRASEDWTNGNQISEQQSPSVQ